MIENAELFVSIGHQQQEKSSGPAWLILGPIVPENEIWTLRLLAAQNGMIPSCHPTDRVTAELNVCVRLPPCPPSDKPPPPGRWVMLEGDAGVPQFKPVKWEGFLELPAGSRLGAWFRGIEVGDLIELNAIYDIETTGIDHGGGLDVKTSAVEE